MKLKYLAVLLTIFLVVSCGNPASGDNPDPDKPTNDASFVGNWLDDFTGSTIKLTETTYEKHDERLGYTEKGSLTYTNTTLTVTKESYKSIHGTYANQWLSTDFNSQFQRDYNSYKSYYGLTDLTEEGYWEVHFDWAYDEFHSYTSGSPYDGYEDSMTLEQYKVAAEEAYTAKLTRDISWEVESSVLDITDNGQFFWYDKQ